MIGWKTKDNATRFPGEVRQMLELTKPETSSAGVKLLGLMAETLPSFSAEINNTCRYTSTLTYVYTAYTLKTLPLPIQSHNIKCWLC
jgi:hypothetical protein